MATTGYQAVADDVPTPLLKWSAIFGGLVLGLAMLLLASALWLALAYGSDLSDIQANLEWYIGISAIVSLFVAGIATGYLSGTRGAGTGMVHGFTLWALLIVLAITIGIPSVLNVFGLQQVASEATTTQRLIDTGDEGALWVTFWTLIGGFLAAGLGGMIGGAVTRSGIRSVTTDGRAAPLERERTTVVVPDTPTSTSRVPATAIDDPYAADHDRVRRTFDGTYDEDEAEARTHR